MEQLNYLINYHSENSYDGDSKEIFLQFLIFPENNDSQEILDYEIHNSLSVPAQESVNGLGFRTLRFHIKRNVPKISFTAKFTVRKLKINPFDFPMSDDPNAGYDDLDSLEFKVEHRRYLTLGGFTEIPSEYHNRFVLDRTQSIFENLNKLTEWVFDLFTYKSGVTTIKTTVADLLKEPTGVCQDYTHVFCAFGRSNGIPCRYVSGYLDQGGGLVGASQMHAWAEALIPGVGWKGFDPTNNLMADHHYIKVSHGRNYKDCAPLKGVIYGSGNNTTKHQVAVASQQ